MGMEKMTYLSLDDVQLYDMAERPDVDPDPINGVGYVTWARAEWTGEGNPAWIRRGLRVQGFAPDGSRPYDAALEDASWDDEETAEHVHAARLAVIGAAGRARLRLLREAIAAMDDGWADTPYDSATKGNSAETLRARFEGIAQQYDGDLRAGLEPSPVQERHVLAVREQLDANRLELKLREERYGWAWWDLLCHLTRLDMPAGQISGFLFTSAEVVRKQQRQVTVPLAAHLMGVSPSTWRSYVARGQAPVPSERIGREPVWMLATLLRHERERPGRPGRPGRPSKS